MTEREGELFSRVYLRPGAALRDSTRFRKRLHAYVENNLASLAYLGELIPLVQAELGIGTPGGPLGGELALLFLKGDREVRDILDSITLIDRTLRAGGKEDKSNAWREFVVRVFEEEALGYTLDAKGAVRYRVDLLYEWNRYATIDGLGAPRYGAVRHLVEAAYGRLDRGTSDTKAAVREMFEAMETLAKLVGQTNEDLDERMVRARLKPLVERAYRHDESARWFASQLVESLGKWVQAGHRYRHGQQTEELLAPPLELAIGFLSSGSSYIRLLVSADTAN